MKIQGRNLIVKLGSTAIACSRSCELSLDADLQEIANPSNGDWKKYRVGKKGWSISVSGLVDVSGGFKAITNKVGTEYTLQFVNTSGTTDEKLSGQAICKSAKLTGTINNLAQWSCEFQGSGQLS